MSDTLSQRQQVAGPPPYYICDWQAAERSVHKLADLRPKVLATGHGIPMRGAQATTQLRALASNFPIPEMDVMSVKLPEPTRAELFIFRRRLLIR